MPSSCNEQKNGRIKVNHPYVTNIVVPLQGTQDGQEISTYRETFRRACNVRYFTTARCVPRDRGILAGPRARETAGVRQHCPPPLSARSREAASGARFPPRPPLSRPIAIRRCNVARCALWLLQLGRIA